MKFIEKITKYGMPLVIALSVALGIAIQRNIGKKQNITTINKHAASKIDALLNYIDKEYVDTINPDEIVESTMSIIMKELDPHSIYISAKDFKKMNEPLEGNFDGIGVSFNIQKDTVSVIKVVHGGPSEKVGIKDGDRIVTVNDSLIAGVKITNNKVMKLLRGKKGTKVKVGIYRRGEPNLVYFTIIRDKIPIYSVDVSYMVSNDIGYIKISQFGRTTYKEFMEAVAKLKAKGMKKIILDLRNNSGGYLDAATNIADEFLDSDKMIVYTQGRSRARTNIYSTHRKSCADMNVAVLIDEWSASASEIVAGAIQDNDRGKIIGRRSFGKGLVQETVMFNDGSSLRLTTARYYTPAGRCIQKPYKKGHEEDYYSDIIKRYEHGEFAEKDSIHFPDSLKYYTTQGRVVYGGGGIMPDVFVPIDTTGNSEYLSAISRKGLEYQFSFDYTDKNRKKLEKFKNIDELIKFLNSDDLLNKFVKYANNNGVKKDKKGLKTSKKIINTQIKAYIARNMFDNDGFFPVIKDVDNTLNKAIKIIKK